MDHYVESVLKEYKSFVMNKKLRPKMLPVQPNYQLPQEDPKTEAEGDKDPRKTFFRSFVMKLQYVATWVRFDISFTASQLASHVGNPGAAHWAALHHLMEYLENYPSFKLVYRRGLRTGKELDAYADSDWGTDVVTRKSISGQIARYNNTPISWRSKKQQSVALSSAEYMAISDFAKEIIYLRGLLRNMGFPRDGPTTVYEDNTACIEWGNNVIGGRERAKHIDIRKHFAHETIRNGYITLKKVATTAQLADIMTKGVTQPQWEMCIKGLLGQPLQPSNKSVVAQEGEEN
jgi:hypothetical protein